MSYIRLRSVKFIRLQRHWKKHSAPSAEEYLLDARAEKLLLAEVHTGCKSSIGVLNPNTVYNEHKQYVEMWDKFHIHHLQSVGKEN
jgi:hypothetical protein